MSIHITTPHKATLYGVTDGVSHSTSNYFAGSVGNDVNPSSYSFKAEDIILDRVPTVRRIVLQYANLGACTLTFTLTGTDDTGATVTTSANKTIGSGPAAPGLYIPPPSPLLTAFVDIELTASRPQLTFSRAGSAGAFYIASILLVGTIEDQTL